MSRERTFTWADPSAYSRYRPGKSGLDVLALIVSGELPPPPMAQLMDIRLIEVSKGRAVFTGTPQEFHYNPLDSVHGGYGATLLDSAMGCAVQTMLDAGDTYTTLEFKINFVRPMTRDTGAVRGIGTIVHTGRTTAIAEGKIEDGAGKLCAFATTTCQIQRAGTK